MNIARENNEIVIRIPDEEHQFSIDELKDALADYFAHKAIRLANAEWDSKNWSDQDVDRLLNTKMRKS